MIILCLYAPAAIAQSLLVKVVDGKRKPLDEKTERSYYFWLKQSLWVPVRVKDNVKMSFSILYISSQSGVMWHSRCPE